MLSNVKIGTDPEMFIVGEDGSFVSSVGLIGGTKRAPRPINNLGDMVQEDNVAVEFNIAPTNVQEVFVNSVSRVIDFINEELKERKLHTVIKASAIFNDDQLNTPQAREFGCEPDYNCWTLSINKKPKAPNPNLRSCGGHIHVGWDNPDMQQRILVARALDLHIAIPSILYDDDKKRRSLYGKSGACRWKDYGVEHRTTSNWWLQNKESMGFVFNQAMRAVDFINNGRDVEEEDEWFIQRAINSGSKKMAEYFMEKYNVCA